MAAWRLALAALAATLAARTVLAQPNMHSNVATLDEHCEETLDKIWGLYTSPNASKDGCNSACLTACQQTLNTALWEQDSEDCPPQSEIQQCFAYYSDTWTAYAAQCGLFAFGTEDAAAGASAEGEGSGSRRRRLQQEAEGAAYDGVSASMAGGCFPPFEDIEEFESYVAGTYQFVTESNSVGIVLSVLFFVGLASIGVFMKG
eukprot:scaffold21.g2191.t1